MQYMLTGHGRNGTHFAHDLSTGKRQFIQTTFLLTLFNFYFILL